VPTTVRFQRVLRADPERVYRAFTDPEALVKWLPPHGFTGRMHAQDLRVGGRYRMSFTHLASGNSHAFGGEYLELTPGVRLRHTDQFDAPELPGEMTVTVDFRRVACGTELGIVQEGIPDAIPAESCILGWQESLALLALLVEAEVPV
jgi:uncharacterized protein YndB with AHSA1/START domain